MTIAKSDARVIAKAEEEEEEEEEEEMEKCQTDSSPNSAWFWVEMSLLNLCSVMWSADDQLLPAVFLELSIHFDVGPAQLGMLTLMRGLSESIFAFPAGFLADRVSRPLLICLSCLLWAAGLAGCALAPNFDFLLACRFINGIGLGLVRPLMFSLVADKTPPRSRGFAFGMIQFTGNAGNTAFTSIATVLASHTICGLLGWQFVFYMIALLSAAVGIAIWLCVSEPPREQKESASKLSAFMESMPLVWRIFKTPTFIIIIAQGVFGTIPWMSFSYFTMWLQLSCFSHAQSATIWACFNAASACGALVFGRVLDCVANRFPDHGVQSMVQISVGSSIPFLAVLFYGLGKRQGGDDNVLLFCVYFFVMGSIISWGMFCNNKMFSNIVPRAAFTHVYAMDRFVEGVLSASGGPLVGLLTEKVFDYNADNGSKGICSPHDAASLGNGMFVVCSITFALCFLCWCFAHYYYPRDRDNAKALEAELEAEKAKAKAQDENVSTGMVVTLEA
eukprot:CAMPEP_0195061490 /NCGR_PEP_ID=MMETSP0448-20130528/8389_1 /TAXON_ID=66468 /ORGANISM="Heterocapsa triquestra, Strain CCMP 448" /LENGTH=503 /DNA_ID=CAMNT_0040092053 /DNA_START=137 /DNA_END=1648 /DNA_ORIENTATION=+